MRVWLCEDFAGFVLRRFFVLKACKYGFEVVALSEQPRRSRRRWTALWSAVWGGIILIALGYLLMLFFQNKTTVDLSKSETWNEFFLQFGPVFVILVGVLVIGNGIIQWYISEQ
jgi:membrane protein YqaA with SNARE-associated domain